MKRKNTVIFTMYTTVYSFGTWKKLNFESKAYENYTSHLTFVFLTLYTTRISNFTFILHVNCLQNLHLSAFLVLTFSPINIKSKYFKANLDRIYITYPQMWSNLTLIIYKFYVCITELKNRVQLYV